VWMGRDPPETAWTADEASAAEIHSLLIGLFRVIAWRIVPCAACHAGVLVPSLPRKSPCK
jgi:hypothetical protein